MAQRNEDYPFTQWEPRRLPRRGISAALTHGFHWSPDGTTARDAHPFTAWAGRAAPPIDDPQNPGGIHWTPDRGLSWCQATGELAPDAPIWTLAGENRLVLAGAADGVFVSEDKGQTWTRSVLGLPPSCPGIAFLVTDSLVLAAASLGR
jgi:hypothetical protein